MAEQESETHPPGTVIQAWSKAWTLNGRLLRPAMVVVAKAPGRGTGRRPAQRLTPVKCGCKLGHCDRMERKIRL